MQAFLPLASTFRSTMLVWFVGLSLGGFVSGEFDLDDLFSRAQKEEERRREAEARKEREEREQAEAIRRHQEHARQVEADRVRRLEKQRQEHWNALPSWRRWLSTHQVFAWTSGLSALVLLVAVGVALWVSSVNTQELRAAEELAAAVQERDERLLAASTLQSLEDGKAAVIALGVPCEYIRLSDNAPHGPVTGGQLYCNLGQDSLLLRRSAGPSSVRTSICSEWGQGALGSEAIAIGGNWFASASGATARGYIQGIADLLQGDLDTVENYCRS